MGGIVDRLVGRFMAWAAPAAPVEQNTVYDLQTAEIMERVLERGSNCIDVGCFKGQMLDVMLRRAPEGRHHAFEPLPHLFVNLKGKYGRVPRLALHDCALGDESGTTVFQHVVTNPGFSGIRRRSYPSDKEVVAEISVRIERLDDIVPAADPVRFVKIDVEGAELGVLRGGRETLRRTRPFVVFEHGVGAADRYGTRPGQVYDLLADCGLRVSLLGDWLEGREPLARAAFVEQFDGGTNYYFLAHP